ncbi:MAG: DUF2309 domain-containing protein [Verrucomicrobia bacterium]|nr:DUF2309 domain-containing protein [Verrucomicrobiota bacterium]
MSLIPSPHLDAASVHAASEEAQSRIPPLWPLRHFVAVNPFLGLTGLPFTSACTLLDRVTGAIPLQSAQDYLEAWKSGVISPTDLAAVSDAEWTPDRLREALEQAGSRESRPIPTVADRLDRQRPGAHWGQFVIEEISKWCAVQFDENQAAWRSPWREQELYRAWREAARWDHAPETFGLTGFRNFVGNLPEDAAECIRVCLEIIQPQNIPIAEFLHRQLATISGWAGHLQYRVREDQLRGKSNTLLRDLLAIRLAYDAALHHAFSPPPADPSESAPSREVVAALVRWQQAYELGFQRDLALRLVRQNLTPFKTRPTAQAIFCIDVRSEVFRRHLEYEFPGIQTLGFAGFFGFPVSHHATHTDSVGARCPALLVPPVTSTEPLSPEEQAQLSVGHREKEAWKAFQNSAASCFSFVETLGLTFGAALGRTRSRIQPTCGPVAPALSLPAEQSLPTRLALAEGALRNMSLTGGFSRLVLICGHGSQSANNPYASGLDCGACGGHAGDVNARLAATTLNQPDVRQGLRQRGIDIPDDTHFLAGLHNTTSDDVTLFAEAVPTTHHEELTLLQDALAAAGSATRRERAQDLGCFTASSWELDERIRDRGTDISQVRPEWGLANNAALIAAPRYRTAQLNLQGRVFLHDYRSELDPEDRVLTLILSAPVVVASWINLQYYASRVDPQRYGSGNKVLHNVVGGLGVLEGNTGDLKVGLPLQSLHNGNQFMHEPRRLSVFIEAPRDRIAAVLSANPGVRQLFDHGWIHLFALDGGACHAYRPEGWRAFPLPDPNSSSHSPTETTR